ncbi:MAG: AAA family ATPase [Candidatus Bathyarchaeota archaeon]|nr:AAA family ATPase [Candidatus Bathyarchaeota archaeon]MCW4052487.1 AAA family ATPase [Candidatus Bathyarchaeota archaeon]
MSASQELEKAATNYASEAVRLDKQGSKGMAITMYQRSIETLLKIVHLYPDYGLNKVYIQRAMSYQERVKVLQGGMPLRPDFEPRPAEATAPQEEGKASYDELIMMEKPNVKWQEVIGLEIAKKAIKEAMVYPVQRPDLFPLGWPRGILLFGPPGCGKTLIAAAVATEIEANFISVDAASIMSKWLGEAERNVAKLFGSARKSANNGKPAIVFIDELDSLLGRHSSEVGGEVRVRNQFLKEMDGVIDKGKALHAYVIGATNQPWDLDWPFIRRFQKRIMVPLPDHHARLQMFKLYTGTLRLDPNMSLHELARLSEGFSGSDIKDTCQSSYLRVIGEFFESGRAHDAQAKPRPVSMQDFRQILEDRKPSVSLDMVASYTKWFDAFKAL